MFRKARKAGRKDGVTLLLKYLPYTTIAPSPMPGAMHQNERLAIHPNSPRWRIDRTNLNLAYSLPRSQQSPRSGFEEKIIEKS